MTKLLASQAELTPSQFRSISELVKRQCGINLHDGKVALVKARLSKRLRALGLTDFGAYMDHVQGDATGSELVAMFDALSTNLTHFFREPRHFEMLRERVIPAMLERHQKDRRLRIWSAGCSSGEEPYSVAITLHDVLGGLGGWDVGILGTDLSVRMLNIAQRGVYPPDRLQTVGPRLLLDHFTCELDRGRQTHRVKEPLRRAVQFARLNLMDPWPMKGQFDAIFCRNVMIYFDKASQGELIERFWQQLAPGGTLFIGHSESLAGVRHRFRYVQPTVYEKPE